MEGQRQAGSHTEVSVLTVKSNVNPPSTQCVTEFVVCWQNANPPGSCGTEPPEAITASLYSVTCFCQNIYIIFGFI